jgi:hypothetical protein
VYGIVSICSQNYVCLQQMVGMSAQGGCRTVKNGKLLLFILTHPMELIPFLKAAICEATQEYHNIL